jgi:hypothetical protein
MRPVLGERFVEILDRFNLSLPEMSREFIVASTVFDKKVDRDW